MPWGLSVTMLAGLFMNRLKTFVQFLPVKTSTVELLTLTAGNKDKVEGRTAVGHFHCD